MSIGKKALWSPCGDALLVSHEERHGWSLYSYDCQLEKIHEQIAPGPVRDFIWHPYQADSHAWCAIIVKEQPINMVRCSVFDKNVSITSSYVPGASKEDPSCADPMCLGFRHDGAILSAGGKRNIYYWDVNNPGVSLGSWSLKGTNSCVSAMHWILDMENVMATGSFSGSISLWDCRANVSCLQSAKIDEYSAIMQLLSGGNSVFSAHRASGAILEWDLRSLANGAVFKYDRGIESAATQQRVHFDIKDGIIWTGGVTGRIHGFKLHNSDPSPAIVTDQLCRDCISGISCHPKEPMLAICSGQRDDFSYSSTENAAFCTRTVQLHRIPIQNK